MDGDYRSGIEVSFRLGSVRLRSFGLLPSPLPFLFLVSTNGKKTVFDKVKFRGGYMYSSRAERIVCDFLLYRSDAVPSRRMRGENRGDLTRACLSGNPFKENGESVGIVPGLKQVLQAEVIRFAFRAA